MCCRLGFGPYWTESYPLLVARKPAPTVAGDRRDESGPSGIRSSGLSGSGGGGEVVRRKLYASPVPVPPSPSLALLFHKKR